MNKKALILLSGGIDSSTLLHFLVKKKQLNKIYALSFSYGQKHIKELEKAKFQAKLFSQVIKHFIIDISFIAEVLENHSSLVGKKIPVPSLKEIDKENLQQPITYVPHRNMLLITLACSYAESLLCPYVFYGAQKQDHYSYWDCTPKFLSYMNKVLSLNHKDKIQIKAPFIHKSKTEIIKLAIKLNVNLEETWTCYRGENQPCLECPSCIEKEKAIKKVIKN